MNVVRRLGSFHAIMSSLERIGTIMADSGYQEALQCSRIFIGGLLLHDNIQMIDHDETEEPDVISREDVKHLKTLCSNIAKQNCDEFTAVQSECLVATPRGRHSQHRHYIFQQNSIAHNYILKQNSIARIYFSRIALPVYTPAKQRWSYR